MSIKLLSSPSVIVVPCAIGYTHQLVCWQLKLRVWPKAVHFQIHAQRATVKTGSDGRQGIFLAEHWWARHYFHLFSAASVVLSTQDSFYNESALVLGPDSEDGRHLCRCLTSLSLISVVSMSTRRLGRSKQKAYAIGLLPSRSWGWPIPQLAKHYKIWSVNVAFTMTLGRDNGFLNVN